MEPDLHLKDIEILLRGFALLIDGSAYAPSMLRFLNGFSKKCRAHDSQQNAYLKELFKSFLGACLRLPDGAFLNPHDRRFNIMLYEAVFTATCEPAFAERRPVSGVLMADRVRELKKDEDFVAAAVFNTTSTANVKKRLSRSREIVRYTLTDAEEEVEGVPSTVVDRLHESFAYLLAVLDDAGELSLRTVADENFREIAPTSRDELFRAPNDGDRAGVR